MLVDLFIYPTDKYRMVIVLFLMLKLLPRTKLIDGLLDYE